MRCRHPVKEEGFTLIEMVVVMAVFIIVLMISASAFNTVLTKSKTVTKSEESNIEGVVGLEMFRHDLTQAGFGLFNDLDPTINPPAYNEATGTYEGGVAFNDSPNGVPRPIIGADNITAGTPTGAIGNTDYLVIKGTTLGATEASQKWTYIDGIGASKTWSLGVNDLKNDATETDYVIAVKQAYKNGEMRRRLIYDSASIAKPYRSDGAYADPFRPNAIGVLYYYYGINEGNPPRAPFNRTDYVVKRITGEVPDRCAPGAGVLYKTTMIQADTNAGGFTSTPVLDCVASMQVVLGWNTSEPAGNDVDTYSKPDGSTPSGLVTALPTLDANYVRKHLKLIKVYILAQDGGLDRSYTNTNTAMVVGDVGLFETNLTDSINLTGANYQNYRWKLYRIVVRPKNLI